MESSRILADFQPAFGLDPPTQGSALGSVVTTFQAFKKSVRAI